jgi:hypothetical protein
MCNSKLTQLVPEAVVVREEASRLLKESEAAAEEVSRLCAKAAKMARDRKVPHAGVGRDQANSIEQKK